MPKEERNDSIRLMGQKVAAFVKERDWEPFHSPKNIAMAMAIEASELMEHFQWLDNDASKQIMNDPEKKQSVAEELADVILYALAFANASDIDLASAIESKLAKNAQKYPVEKAKGNATKYMDL